ncbi:MAG: DUF554 domain-containing protein [Oscillospiraceae bacterium]|nr:DUF554 domain-containing protein [Oscillospiraceae bacterium]
MPGTGTLINVIAIILGGFFGLLFGKSLSERHRDTLCKACGICVLFIGISGALEGMLKITEGSLKSSGTMLIIASLAIGALIGEIINIEDRFENFGEWLKMKTGNAKDKDFVEGFVTASLTVCIGAMAIVGAIEDGILGDYSVLAAKAVLDLIIIMVMTCSLGKGCAFSAIPVAALQGSVTLLSNFIKPIMTEEALMNLSVVGSILIFCVGLNLVWGKKIRVANLLPSIIVAVAAAFLPFEL